MKHVVALIASLCVSAAAHADELLSTRGPECSKMLAAGKAMASAARRDCLIAVASTYIDAEANTIPPEKQLLADDVSRHQMGTPPKHDAGNGPKIIADHGHGVIAAIKNRQWTADGDQIWIAYDGYLKSDLEKPSFFVAERFTIVKGLIREILIAPVAHTDERRQ